MDSGGVAWPARGCPGDGRGELSSPPSLERPYKKARNNVFQAYPSHEEVRGGGQGGLPSHAASDKSYGGLPRAPSFNHSQGIPAYGRQQQTQMVSNGYAQNTSSPRNNTPSSGFPPGSARGTGALFFKTKLCTKFKLGTCTFEDRCHFAHGMEDLRKPPISCETMVVDAGQGDLIGGRSNDGFQQRKKSSKPCRFFADGKECPYGDRCTFVHTPPGDDMHAASGLGDLESGGMPPLRGRFKTRMCAKWERGEPCKYGERCHYAHGYAELQITTGGSTFGSDNTTAVNNAQYPSSTLEVAPYSTQYSNTMNPPTSAPHGGPFTDAITDAPNPFPTRGTGAQESVNDYPKPQSYWNGAPAQGGHVAPQAGHVTQGGYVASQAGHATQGGYAAPQAGYVAQGRYVAPQAGYAAQGGYPMPQSGYVQVNQAAGGWAGNHAVEGGYSKDPSSTVQYIPAPIQQQPGVQPYASGSAVVYQEPQQIVSAPYVQDGNGSDYRTEAIAGKGGYYLASY